MTAKIADVHIALEEMLPTPLKLRGKLPISDEEAACVATSRAVVQDILAGRDDRLLVVAGPCSIHDPTSAIEYAQRLRAMAKKHQEDLFLVMRVYFEKPRTRLGWKGLIYDPHLDGRGDIGEGLRTARSLLLECARLGVPAGSEILDLATPQYYAELLSWGAIGARTTESPLHRQMASALSAPVGFKNSTSGDIRAAIDAIIVAAQSHRFPSISINGQAIVVTTTGNPYCHLVLRGGQSGPNYDARSVASAAAALESAGLPPRLMIDCSHANSGGNTRRQAEVAAEVGAQIEAGSEAICAVMMESHLLEGRQAMEAGKSLRYGQSVTDACIGWDTTADLLDLLSEAARSCRKRRRC